ncbi:MAG: substrate-binding domain-containing protein [Bacteroidales bacterium]
MNNNNVSKIRIKDIAGLAGVSAGTVDRVLHNRGEVSEKTRKKVLEIIRELDYQPDILASILAAKRNFRIAVLIPGVNERSTFWKYPLEGIDDGFREIMHFGISIDRYFFDYFDRKSFVDKSAEMMENKPHGLILAPVFAEEASNLVKRCKEIKIPVVLVNANVCMEDCIAFVGQDSFQSGMVAAKIMHYGLKDNDGILIVNFIKEEVGRQAHIVKREEGFRSFYENSSKCSNKSFSYLNITDVSQKHMETVLEDAIYRVSDPLKGIFVTNSMVFHVARFLEKKGLNDIVLIGYDLLDENMAYLRKGGIDFIISQRPHEQGFRSVMALFHHLVLKKEVDRNQYLPIDIITRENLGHYIYK